MQKSDAIECKFRFLSSCSSAVNCDIIRATVPLISIKNSKSIVFPSHLPCFIGVIWRASAASHRECDNYQSAHCAVMRATFYSLPYIQLGLYIIFPSKEQGSGFYSKSCFLDCSRHEVFSVLTQSFDNDSKSNSIFTASAGLLN